MHSPPSTEYSGLTLLLPRPSRFDKECGRLISGTAREYMAECLSFSLESCDVRDLSETTPLLPNTQKLALLGDDTYKLLGQARPGYSGIYRTLLAMPAFFPQDCVDHRPIESKLVESEDDDEEDDAVSDRDTKDDYPTRFKNRRFWNKWFLRKLLSKPTTVRPPRIVSYPSLDTVVSWLSTLRNEDLFLDIETHRARRCLTCIGLSSSSLFPTVFVVPVYTVSDKPAYHDFHKFYKALSLALSRNTVVAHNAMFDLLILHAFYKFRLPERVYDTMLANHRIFPEIEKSLSHLIAQWTWQPYHKDTTTEVFNTQQESRMWNYNGLDVYNLKLIKDAQTSFSKVDAGMISSITQVNSSIIPYLENSVTGLRIDQAKLVATEFGLQREIRVYTKIIRLLIGDPKFNPRSPPQCVKFFHDTLKYPIQARGANGPKLGKKQFYQLLLKTGNPVIPVILKYRAAAKDLSMLEAELYSTSRPPFTAEQTVKSLQEAGKPLRFSSVQVGAVIRAPAVVKTGNNKIKLF